MRTFAENYPRLFLLVLSGLLFIPFLGSVHLFDWDEINFAESSREMLITGDWSKVTINFQLFWEKPPLFIWMQALSMKAFGVNEFAARFPNAVCGILSMQWLYYLGSKRKGSTFGLIWASVFGCSLLPLLYFKTGIIDPWFNLFIFSGVWLLSRSFEEKSPLQSLTAGIFIGLAVLTKGPVALLLAFLAWLVIWGFSHFSKSFFQFRQLFIFAISALLVGSSWFLYLISTSGMDVVMEFFLYQIRLFSTPDAGHGQPWYYHPIVVLIGCFPMSWIGIRRLFGGSTDNMERWMRALFWVVMVLFSITTTKIVHYSSLCYLPMSYLAAGYLFENVRWPNWQRIAMGLGGIILGLVLLSVPVLGITHFEYLPKLKDPFAAEAIKAAVDWNYYDLIPGSLFIFASIVLFVQSGKNRKLTTANSNGGESGLLLLNSIYLVAVALALTMIWIAPKVEAHSQRAAILFFQQHSSEKASINVFGFKSYAHLFYGEKKLESQQSATMKAEIKREFDAYSQRNTEVDLTKYSEFERSIQLYGKIEEPVYICCRIQKAEEFAKLFPYFKQIGKSNGFVFWKRDVPVTSPTSSQPPTSQVDSASTP